MKILIDMNLTPLWVQFSEKEGIEAVHWPDIGDPAAPDSELFQWVKNNGFIVLASILTLDKSRKSEMGSRNGGQYSTTACLSIMYNLRRVAIVFTHDLDFGAILAATKADAPSVVQVRTQDTMPQVLSVRLDKFTGRRPGENLSSLSQCYKTLLTQ